MTSASKPKLSLRRSRQRTARFAMRWGTGAAILAVIALMVSDSFTSFWIEHPMTSQFVVGLFLIIVGAAVVSGFIAARARRNWQTVAALAITQFRDGTRELLACVTAALATSEEATDGSARARSVHSPVPIDLPEVERLTQLLLATDNGSQRMLTSIENVLPQAQSVAASWAPVMVSEPDYAELLDLYVDLLNRAWRITWALDKRLAGSPLPEPGAIATELRDLVADASDTERVYTTYIRSLLSWPASFGPAPGRASVADMPGDQGVKASGDPADKPANSSAN